MNASFLEKASPLSGIVTVVLLVYGLALIKPTDYFPTPERATEIFSENPARIQQGATAAGFYSVVFLLWFVSSVFNGLSQGSENSIAPAFALGGGIVLAIGLMLANGIFWFAAGRASRAGGMSPETAVIFYDLIQVFLSNVISIGLAVFIGATGIGSLQTHLFPIWLGWASLILAIGLLTPFHYIFEGLGFIWILAASIALYK